MLVLSRKKQESIFIGDEIEVIVLEIAENRVRLGFRCPGHISVAREEIFHFGHENLVSHQQQPQLAALDLELTYA